MGVAVILHPILENSRHLLQTQQRFRVHQRSFELQPETNNHFASSLTPKPCTVQCRMTEKCAASGYLTLALGTSRRHGLFGGGFLVDVHAFVARRGQIV